MTLSIYHNPRCSKSRQTLQLLQEHGKNPDIILYLETPPDDATLADMLAKLDGDIMDIFRTGETEFKEAREAIENMSDTEKLCWLASNPKVLQRPIVVSGQQARIGRPPESILEILS
jgi:arsenate reductase